MKQITKFILPYWKKGLVPVLFLFVSTVISFAYPLFPKWAIDDVLMNKNHDNLIILAGLFLLLIVLQRLFTYLNEISFFRFQKSSILDIQKKLLAKVFSYPLEFFNKNHSGYLMGRIRGDVNGLSYIFSVSVVDLFMNGIKFFGVLIILFTLNVKLTILSICIIPFLTYKILCSRKKVKEINEKILEENARLEKELSDTFQGMEVLKSFSKEEEGKSRAEEALSDYQKVEIRRNEINSKYRNIVGFIVHIGEVLLLYFGIRQVIMGKLSIGSYMAFSGYLIYLYSPIQDLSLIFVFLDYAKRSYQRIKELMDILPEDSGEITIKDIHQISVHNLAFSYDGNDKVINGVNFCIQKGDKILIKGDSGSGKSTLIRLLLGLYRVKEGEIKYNNVNLKKINLKNLREQIGYISQDIFLFNKSLRENITFNNSKVSDDDLWELLGLCKLDDRVKEFEMGLDHVISEKGVNFSGGEKQMIALARALIKNPDVIIIDEGTSNLDIETEEEILKIIEEKFKNNIILRVTHRKIEDKGWKKLFIVNITFP